MSHRNCQWGGDLSETGLYFGELVPGNCFLLALCFVGNLKRNAFRKEFLINSRDGRNYKEQVGISMGDRRLA
jgi:hypothetical protein